MLDFTQDRSLHLTKQELFFEADEIIVSKTNTKGIITYANATFAKLAETDIKYPIGKPHNFIRHPEMPKAIFKLLWETITSGNEIFAYVLNRSMKGNEYWVLAHVTPSFNKNCEIVGFHSNRRVPNRAVLEGVIMPLYEKMRRMELEAPTAREGMEQSYQELQNIVADSGKEYNHFILSLGEE